MPLYEYYCEENEKIISVKHGMTDKVDTWADLCALAQVKLGETSKDAKVTKLISGGMNIPRKTTQTVSESSCDTGGCGCC